VRRLAAPCVSAEEAFNSCKNGIGTADLKNRVEAGIGGLSQIAALYESQAKTGELFTVAPFPKDADENAVVAVDLTKKEFINLYEYYLRNTDKPGRAIYDALMVAADEKCPFCGGIGRPRNLDHFMPKAFFPQFSTIPMNLIPACRDCNMDGKGQGFAQTAYEQILHPYLDNDRFFIEQWVYAHVIPGNPCSIEYFVCAPEHWNTIDQRRVAAHFHDFELAKRYSIQAAEELAILISQRRGFMKQLPSVDFSQYLASFIDSPLFVNHWKKVMYQCLAVDEWFCTKMGIDRSEQPDIE
jgi:hypothetical protein